MLKFSDQTDLLTKSDEINKHSSINFKNHQLLTAIILKVHEVRR